MSKIAKGQIRRLPGEDTMEITEVVNGIASFKRNINGQTQMASANAAQLEAMTTLVSETPLDIDRDLLEGDAKDAKSE